MYTQQLSDLRANLGIQSISGCCHDSALFADQVNTVTRRLMVRGEWHKTSVLMRLCFQGCKVTWPRQVGTILAAKSCCGGFVLPKNSWWAVAGYGHGWCGGAAIRDDNYQAVQNQVTGNTGKILRLHIANNKDIGKTLKIFGMKYGNQPLQQQLPDGTWEMGLTMTAGQVDVNTTVLVTRIDQVVKQATSGGMWLYEVEPDGALFMLSAYDAGETNPSYRTSVVTGAGGRPDAYGRCVRMIEALVSLEFVPAKSDNDWVLLSNLDALELGIVGLRAERANDDVLAGIKFARAIQELNMELRHKNPGNSTVIRTNDFSSSCILQNPI